MDAAAFHDMIVKEFQLQNLSLEEQTGYVDQIGELVLQGVIVKALSALDSQHVAELDQYIDSGKSASEIMSYLRSLVPGLNELINDEVLGIKNDLATGLG